MQSNGSWDPAIRSGHQFMPSFRLRIVRIFYLKPYSAVAFINPEFALRYDSFQLAPANQFKEPDAQLFDMLRINDS